MSLPQTSKYNNVNVPGYKIVQRLGSGSYSTVYKASKESSQEYVAIKCIEKTNLSRTGRDNIINEIKIMKILQHEFIVKLLDFQWDERYVYLVMEFCCVGDLNSFIKKKHRLPESVFLKFLQQLALALKFLRSHNISHFDLKPQNLLLTKNPKLTLKIGDFGLAQFLSEDSLKTSLRGSPLYMAPEMLLNHKSSAKADLWSVGVIAYQCLFGRPPVIGTDMCAIAVSHKNENPIEIPKNIVSSECEEFLSRLLVYDPEVRIDFDEFFSHRFLQLKYYPSEESYASAVSLVHQAVQYDTDKNYEQAFKHYVEALQYLVPYIKEIEHESKKEFIYMKVLEYTNRAEELQLFLAREKGIKGSSVLYKDIDKVTIYSPQSLDSLFKSTPSLSSALKMGRMGQMYLLEMKYSEALECLKSALSMAIPLVQTEPHGNRRDLLCKQVDDWLTKAENIKVLLSAKDAYKIDETHLETYDTCLVQ